VSDAKRSALPYVLAARPCGVASVTALLRALVFSVWASVHHGPLPADADPIADAIVAAVMADAGNAPALGSHALDAVTMALWSEHESHLQREPRPVSWDARALVSCGPWQIRCDLARSHSVGWQARYWLAYLHHGARVCPDSPAAPLSSGSCHRGRALADWRVSRARAVLSALLRQLGQDE
jgi:hypothetical protein